MNHTQRTYTRTQNRITGVSPSRNNDIEPDKKRRNQTKKNFQKPTDSEHPSPPTRPLPPPLPLHTLLYNQLTRRNCAQPS